MAKGKYVSVYINDEKSEKEYKKLLKKGWKVIHYQFLPPDLMDIRYYMVKQ